MKLKKVSFVIPLFNERESLDELIQRLGRATKNQPWKSEFIFIDDGSTDGSFEELKRLKRRESAPMTIVRFRKRSGKSMAMSEGFGQSTGDVIVTLDADLQDDPAEAPKLIRKLSEGYDVVVGWRKVRMDHHNKLRLSSAFNRIVSGIVRLPLHDMNCGLKAMRRGVVQEIDVYGELHRFIPVLAKSQGFTVTEVVVVHHPRKYGASKFPDHLRILRAPFDLLTTLFLTMFRTRPLQIFGPVGVVFIFIGIVSLIYLSALHFMGQTIGRRPLLMFAILLVLFGVQLVSTGLIGELITKANIRKEKRPVEEIIA